MRRLTRVDCSAASFLAECRCGWRAGPTATRGEAERLTDRHLDRTHPGAVQDTAARRTRASRARRGAEQTFDALEVGTYVPPAA